MENPFHTIKNYMLEIFPGAYDIVYVLGKGSRAIFILLIIALALSVRETWVRMVRKDLTGEAFALHQAFAFAALAYAFQAPYALIPEISWKLVLAVSTTLLIYFASLAGIRVFCAHAHERMIRGDVNAALRLGLYALGAGFVSHAVVTAAFSG
jgi:hypothetical protein